MAVVLVLALVVVLVGLLGSGGSGGSGGSEGSSGSDAVPGATGVSARATPSAVFSPALTPSTRRPSATPTRVALSELPRQAQATVALIDAGGPFPYSQDGATFGNYERVLPAHPRGWYREYTVPTPGERDRGPRRIVTGDDDRLIYYTPDHYASFVEVSR